MDISTIVSSTLAGLGEPVHFSAIPVLASLAIGFLFVLLQGLFGGYETGVVSANPIRLNHLVETGSRTAKVFDRLLQRRDRLLTLTLVGTNVAMVCATILVASRIGKLWTTLFMVPTSLIIGEIMAKSLFRHHATRLVLALAYPIRFFYIVLFPIVALATAFSNSLLMLLTGKSWGDVPGLTREELRYVFLEGEKSAAIEPAERAMIHRVIDLSTTMVKEIMVPRTRMVAVELRATQRELVNQFEQSGYSRMPVYETRVDNVVGIVNVFDVIRDGVGRDEESIERFIRPAYYVPDTKRVGELLQELRARKTHMAIVIDEYGGTDGIVTLEDVVEEIFGEIQDEYDEEPPAVQPVGENSVLVDASLDIEEASEALGIELPVEDADTLSGFILKRAGRIPVPGDRVEYQGLQFEIVQTDGQRISKVKVDIPRRNDDGG